MILKNIPGIRLQNIIFLFCSVFSPGCSDDDGNENSDLEPLPVEAKRIIGFELTDNIDGFNFTTEFVYTDTLITAINIVEANETFANYEYDNSGRLILSDCSCSDEFNYTYQGEMVAEINGITVLYSNDSIYVNGAFEALVNNGNVVSNSFSTRSHSTVEVPNSFKHFYAIFQDEHFPLHQDSNLLEAAVQINNDARSTLEYSFDDQGNVSSMRIRAFEAGELLDDETYNFTYE